MQLKRKNARQKLNRVACIFLRETVFFNALFSLVFFFALSLSSFPCAGAFTCESVTLGSVSGEFMQSHLDVPRESTFISIDMKWCCIFSVPHHSNYMFLRSASNLVTLTEKILIEIASKDFYFFFFCLVFCLSAADFINAILWFKNSHIYRHKRNRKSKKETLAFLNFINCRQWLYSFIYLYSFLFLVNM